MSSKRKIHTVNELNLKARNILENSIQEVWVEGELSRVTLHSSGHWYFTLKDEFASVSCAMFSRDNKLVQFEPKEGLKVCLFARASIYEVTGRYQIIVSEMEEAGKGSLQQQFELLKSKLDAEGLFNSSRKKELPMVPEKIGVITSPTGAAIRDIINILTRRFPGIQILVAPVSVQGEGSAKSIVAAIKYMNTREDLDLLIVGRGGGSMEDLWSFNEEIVARSIANSKLPIISAVGHEIDFTIADFVADLRAPTPSAAAELAVKNKSELYANLNQYKNSLSRTLIISVQDIKLRLNQAALNPIFHEPKQSIQIYKHAILRIKEKIRAILIQKNQIQSEQIKTTRMKISYVAEKSLQKTQQRIDEFTNILQHQLKQLSFEKKAQLNRLESQLKMLNPHAVLGRGYSITYNQNGSVISSAKNTRKDDNIKTVLKDGTLISIITKAQ